MLKLYVWEGVLVGWGDGLAIAYASNVKQAVKMLKENGLCAERFDGSRIDGVSPKVYRSPKAYYIYGSD